MNDETRSVAVIGLGFVGLPLSMAFAEKGYRVFGVDIDNQKIESLNQGKSYINEVSMDALQAMAKKGAFTATYDFSVVNRVDAIIICVPTPLKNQEPDLSYVISSIQFIKPHLRAGHLIVLESSTYPGTTENDIRPRLEQAGFTIGEDLFVGYSPERIDPGNSTQHMVGIPKIISGCTEVCLQKVTELYNSVFLHTVPVSSTKVAEFVKLFENSQRMVNISFVNEISLLAGKLNIDIWEAIEAAKTKPMGFHVYYPSAGIGGHCIPVDPYYLSWVGLQEGVPLTLVLQAGLVNERMPHYVSGRVISYLKQQSIPADQAKVGVIGVTYKKDVSDIRESAALKVIRLLQQRRVEVHVHDDVYEGELSEQLQRFSISEEDMKQFDLTLILVDHSKIDWVSVVRFSRHVMDTRNVTRELDADHITRI